MNGRRTVGIGQSRAKIKTYTGVEIIITEHSMELHAVSRYSWPVVHSILT